MKTKLKNNGYSYMDYYIAEHIKEERLKRGISLTDFANELNLSKQRYSMYEKTERSMPLDVFFKCCSLLNIDDEKLYTEAQEYMRKEIFK